jgi:hypothetical protein
MTLGGGGCFSVYLTCQGGIPPPDVRKSVSRAGDKPGVPGLAWLNTTHVDALCAWCLTTDVARTWINCFSSGYVGGQGRVVKIRGCNVVQRDSVGCGSIG